MKAETPELAGLLAQEQAIRRETEILRDANIALTQNLSLERVARNPARFSQPTGSLRQRKCDVAEMETRNSSSAHSGVMKHFRMSRQLDSSR